MDPFVVSLPNHLIIFAAYWLIYFPLLSIPYLWVKGKRCELIGIVISVLVAYALEEGLNLLFPVPRPFVAGGFAPLIGVPPREYYTSFPSGHATVIAALGTSVFFTERRLGILILVLGVLVGVGRVMAGVHYWIDILAGFILGIAVASLVKFVHNRCPFW